MVIPAGIVSALAFVFLFVAVSHNQSSSSDTTLVVATTKDLTAAHQISSADVTTVSIPSSDANDSYFKDPQKLVNQYMAIKVTAGTLLVNSMVLPAPAAAGLTLTPLDVPVGDVAISIPFDPTRDIGGYVQAEDRIDIYVQQPSGELHTGFQDVRVLRVGSLTQTAGSPTVLVVDLPRQKALDLVYLLNSTTNPASGSTTSIVKYALRSRPSYGAGTLPDKPVGAGTLTTLPDG